jgi:hypothetical protein
LRTGCAAKDDAVDELLGRMIDNALPLVAVAWAASVLFLVVAARRYFASRARPPAEAEAPARVEEPPDPSVRVEPTLSLPDAEACPVDALADEDQQPGNPPLPAVRASAPSASDLREALVARVARDPDSTDGLRDLVRALYLDQSNFRFHAIAELPAEDRLLARQLLDAWLADPSAVDHWEAMYAAFREGLPAERRTQQA